MNIYWSNTDKFPVLAKNTIHVYLLDLRQAERELSQYQACLITDEMLRADKILHLESKKNFIASRGALRKLLGQYLNLAPQKIQLLQNSHGKLFLPNLPLEFNLSHSKDFAAFAFSSQGSVGIDIEYMRNLVDAEEIARRFFSAKEVADLLALPIDLQRRAFFQVWSRKEAFIKALGVGIFYPLHQFSVAVDEGKIGPVTLQIHDDQEKTKKWHLIALDLAPNYSVAVCAESAVHTVVQFH
jgi:4'-phosphopantetheinyl transferase